MSGRRVIDAGALPDVAFGHRSLMWWGTVAFIVIEGTTLAVVASAYLYVRRNFIDWPPQPTPLPELLLPTIVLVVLLLAMLPMHLAARAAHRFDARRASQWLAIGGVVGLTALLLRVFEFPVLNTQYDHHAYGSLAWLLLGLHAVLLGVDVLETFTLGAILRSTDREDRHFADVDEASMYQTFLSLVWVPVYLLLYIAPRVM